jgi:hypothetical protein
LLIGAAVGSLLGPADAAKAFHRKGKSAIRQAKPQIGDQ